MADQEVFDDLNTEELDLGTMELDIAAVSDTPEPVPAGPYAITFEKAVPRRGKNPPHTPYIACTLTITQGEKAGRKLYYNMMLGENSLWVLKRTLRALELDFEQLAGQKISVNDICEFLTAQEAIASVDVQERNGIMQNQVQKIIGMNSEEAIGLLG